MTAVGMYTTPVPATARECEFKIVELTTDIDCVREHNDSRKYYKQSWILIVIISEKMKIDSVT